MRGASLGREEDEEEACNVAQMKCTHAGLRFVCVQLYTHASRLCRETRDECEVNRFARGNREHAFAGYTFQLFDTQKWI